MLRISSIKTKMIFSFSILISIQIITSILTYYAFSSISKNVSRIVEVNVKRDHLLAHLEYDISQISYKISTMILAYENKNVFVEEIKKLRADYGEKLNLIENQLISKDDEKGKELLQKLKTAIDNAKPVNTKIMEYALAGNDTESRMMLINQALPLMDSVYKALDELQDHSVKRTEMRYTIVKETIRDTILILLFSLCVLIATSIVVAYILIRNVVKPVVNSVEVFNAISEGHLDIKIENNRNDEIGQLLTAIMKMVDKLKQIITNIKVISDNVALGSEQLSASAQQLSQGATEQAASVEETSASMEEMSSSIKQNADNAMETKKIAVKTAEYASESGESVEKAVNAMKEIASKISIIEEIARQTNLLALNAAIEAARAGEHGKGFAVVASEVRKLAERSQQAAAEINELSVSSVRMAETVGEAIRKLIPEIQRTAELVQEISASSNEQAKGVEQMSKALQQLDKVVQQNASAAEELASTSEELASQSDQLKYAISFFKINSGENLIYGSKKEQTKKKKNNVNAKKEEKIGGVEIKLNDSSDDLDKEFEKF
jgi:methyl-accepting chemotaxis protein